MPDKSVKLNLGRVPFDRAIEYLREKVDVGTKAYSDLMHGAHDTAFVVAGLTKGEILSDVHKLVNKAIQEGTPFDKFQKDFAKTIEGRWLPRDKRTGEPNTGWRAKIIYQTNIRTAYAAGRHEQLQRIKATHPYWQYRHGDSRKPREEHLAWDGLVLRADDPWWKTHYPPNGWGCRCYVHALDDIDLREMGKKGPDDAPPSPLRTVKYGDRTVEVPVGIDPGWAYVPGETVSPPPPGQLLPDVNGPNAPIDGQAQARERQLERMPPDIARQVRAEIDLGRHRQPEDIDAMLERVMSVEKQIAELPPEKAKKVREAMANMPPDMDFDKRLDEQERLIAEAKSQPEGHPEIEPGELDPAIKAETEKKAREEAEKKAKEDAAKAAKRAAEEEKAVRLAEIADKAETEFLEARKEADRLKVEHQKLKEETAKQVGEARRSGDTAKVAEADAAREKLEDSYWKAKAKCDEADEKEKTFKEADREAARAYVEPLFDDVQEVTGQIIPKRIRITDAPIDKKTGHRTYDAMYNPSDMTFAVDRTFARGCRRNATQNCTDGSGYCYDPVTFAIIQVPSKEKMQIKLLHEMAHHTEWMLSRRIGHDSDFNKSMYAHICKRFPDYSDRPYAWHPPTTKTTPTALGRTGPT
jgi:SPP1 gp7 family putative phage head morphogenesis protein